MIPKIIHYCWFGEAKKSKLAEKCIKSWKKYCPDYKIIEWNESNFDITSNQYVQEAYTSKKWAFVTDYVRLWALYNYGGIYMDTDVEVLRKLDPFLEEKAFSGFETDVLVPTGLMASEKKLPIIKILLDRYSNRQFLSSDGTMDMTTNVEEITNVLRNYGLQLNGKKQIVMDFTLYPKDYFCPKDSMTGDMNITDNTYTIHHFDGSWLSGYSKFKKRIRYMIGINNWNKIKRIFKLHGIEND